MKHGPVETHVALRGALPCQVGVAQRGRIDVGHRMLLARLPPVLPRVAVHRQIAVVAHAALVTRLSPTGTQLEVVYPTHALHPVLARDTPCRAHRGKECPAVLRRQLRRPVRTEVGRYEVARVVVVTDAGEGGHDSPIAGGGTRAARVNLVRRIQRLHRTIGEVARADIRLCPSTACPR